MDSEPEPPAGRRGQIDARLDAIRARIADLSEPNTNAINGRVTPPGERLQASQHHILHSRAAATSATAAAVRAFRTAAEAHERVASVHDRMAASAIGDVCEHERQAARHRAAAQADRRRAALAQSLLSELDRRGLLLPRRAR